jgi:hypothetical protein
VILCEKKSLIALLDTQNFCFYFDFDLESRSGVFISWLHFAKQNAPIFQRKHDGTHGLRQLEHFALQNATIKTVVLYFASPYRKIQKAQYLFRSLTNCKNYLFL